ncbi:MAG: TonB family protein, partial [Pyrinomonadaceae bacterium]|nr:TonB family protein [Pyrinomonadaceae bacterium]
PPTQFGAPQQSVWTPPVSASKAGLVLTLSALAIIGLGITSLAAVGFFAYRGIAGAIEKVAEEKERREITQPTPPIHGYPTPTPYQTPTGKNPSGNKSVSGGVLNGKAIELPKPPYPAAARAVRASGAVNVQVMVDENGNVISASAVTGHPLLRASAEQSARAAKFTPTILGGKAVKISGVIVYDFAPE